MRRVRPRLAAGGWASPMALMHSITIKRVNPKECRTYGVPVMAMRPSNSSAELGDDGAAAAEGTDGNESDMVLGGRELHLWLCKKPTSAGVCRRCVPRVCAEGTCSNRTLRAGNGGTRGGQ